MMKCRYKKYFSGLIGEFCAKAGLEHINYPVVFKAILSKSLLKYHH